MVDNNSFQTSIVTQKLDYWSTQLRDMGRRNALLYFKETKSSSFKILKPDIFSLYERVVINGRPIYAPLPEEKPKTLFDKLDEDTTNEKNDNIPLRDDEFSSNNPINQLNKILKNLKYRSRLIREEQGFNALYLGFGVLKWQEGLESEFSYAPLILVPIEIEQTSSVERPQIRQFEDDFVVNPTLRDKLTIDFGISIEEINQDMSVEELNSYFDKVNERISKFKGWQVCNDAVVGIFNFQNLLLINDLKTNSKFYEIHPIIKMLSGLNDESFDDSLSLIKPTELDDKVDPRNVFQILDADSSQQEAIEAAKQGVSFVLEGPPGTGKSQTIANIIAESLAAGKKILFVSQKSVALDVVHRRLAQKGLGEFCLEVHSYKKNKKDVIQDLGKSLFTVRDDNKKDITQRKKELIRIRSTLNEYVKELHLPRYNLNISLFSALGNVAKLQDYPDIRFSINDIEAITDEQHDIRLSTIREISTYDEIISNYNSHPWKGVKLRNITIQDSEEIEEHFQKIVNTIALLEEFANDFSKALNLIKPTRLDEIFTLLNVLMTYKPIVFSMEYEGLINRYLSEYNSVSKVFKIQYWKDRSKLRELQWGIEKLPFETIVQLLKEINKIPRINNSKVLLNSIPELDYQRITFANEWKSQLFRLLGFVSNLYHTNETPKLINNFYDSLIDDLKIWLQARSNQTNLLFRWVNFNNLLDRGKNIALDEFIEKAFESKISPSVWENVYDRRFYLLLSDHIIQSIPILSKFQGLTHEALIKRFRQIDRELIEQAGLEIREKLFKTRPETPWVQAGSAETIILKKELNKKRRIKPLRILFSEIPNLILNLKPCLMMSPHTVCQLLDPEVYEFDIAIFDEASQIPPEYAVSTITRAKQVIIAGDRHQLPPTRFFQTLGSDDYDDENYEIEDFESILNACDAINLPSKMLLWHYRSEDESLIAFSNLHFYDNKLLTFPNSKNDNGNVGLEFVFVKDGIYRRGKGGRDNPIEARKVAELVLESLQKNQDLSVGVVAFSQSQRQRIEQEIEQIQREKPYLNALFDYNKTEHVFIKNLETVQGDERDIIIFSIGYGKDELGNLSMNFGPLNRQGGERRLNVAVTRARKAVKLVSSFEPEDIDLSRTQSNGVKLLKSYMKAARDGINSIYNDVGPSFTAEFASPFEESVYNSLTKRGLRLQKQVGVSNYRIDFGVIDPDKPGRYILGIECDGATYHSSPTARDRDRLRQQLLEEKFGWTIHRIWSRDWFDNPNQEIVKILNLIEEIRNSSLDKKKARLK